MIKIENKIMKTDIWIKKIIIQIVVIKIQITKNIKITRIEINDNLKE